MTIREQIAAWPLTDFDSCYWIARLETATEVLQAFVDNAAQFIGDKDGWPLTETDTYINARAVLDALDK